MKSPFLTMVLSAAMTFAVISVPLTYTGDVEAKRFSSRSSSSFSRSSYRSPSRSYSSPSKSSSKSSSTTRSGGFWKSKSKKTSNKSLKTGGAKKNTMASGGKRSTKTKEAVKIRKQQAKFKKPAVLPPGLKKNTKSVSKPRSRRETNTAYRNTYNSNPVYNRARTQDSSTYYNRRNSYYGANYQTPTYVYNSPSSFGMWDTIFLYSMMSNMNNASQFSHNHQNDPDYKAWRAEAEEQAKTNAELRAQLAAIDAESAKLAGSPVDPGYLPEGVDADIAMSQGARLSALPDMKVCAGQSNGAYFVATAGVMAPKAEFVNIVPVITAGTEQSLEYITAGKCDAAWVQANGYWNFVEDNGTAALPFTRVFSPYREAIHVICHQDGPTAIDDLDEDNTLLFPKGSGAVTTMRDWIGEDDDYEDIKTILTDSTITVDTNSDALLKVSQNKDMCMMYVAAQGATQFMKDAEKSAKSMKIVLIDVADGDLDDTTDPSGEDVYSSVEIDSSVYPNLTRQSGSFFGSGDVHTLDVNADFIIADAWKKKNPGVYGKISIKIAGMEDNIKAVLKP